MKPFLFFLLLFSSSLFSSVINNSQYNPAFFIPPPEYPSDDNPLILSITSAYTFWEPYQQNMVLLTTNLISQTKADNPIFLTQNWIEAKMEARNGFKVGFGLNTLHDGWTLLSEYTWFYNNPPMKSTYLEINNWKYASPWLFPMNTFLEKFSSSFQNQFNRINTTLQRSFYAGDYLAFFPWIGFLGAWEKQYLYIYGESINYDAENPKAKSSTYQKKKFWCIGPYGGIDASYFFIGDWAIYLSSGTSLNLSQHQTYAEFNPISNTHNPPYKNCITSTKYYSLDPMLESSIGLRWDCIGIHWQLQLQVSWEMQVWYNHNSFIRFNSLTIDTYANKNNYPYNFIQADGNYSMQGLTAKINLFF